MKPSLVLVGVANVGVRAASSSNKRNRMTVPALAPLPSLPVAPIATLEPSPDSATDQPEKSPAASPSMPLPTSVHVPSTRS